MTTTTHPDLAHIRQIANDMDREAYDLQESIPNPLDRIREVLGGAVDMEALHTAARERAEGIIEHTPPLLLMFDLPAVIEAAWAEAFTAGLRFQASGGTTPEGRERQ